jgi:hypothetical protein
MFGQAAFLAGLEIRMHHIGARQGFRGVVRRADTRLKRLFFGSVWQIRDYSSPS